MKRLQHFATFHPVLFVLAAIVVRSLLDTLGIAAAITILDATLVDPFVQSAGTLFATVCVLGLAWYWGWLKPAGFTPLGGLGLWRIILATTVYTMITYQLACFDEKALGFA